MINQLVSINYRWYDPNFSILPHPLPPKNDIFLKGEKIAHQAEKYFFFTLVPPSAMKTIYTSYTYKLFKLLNLML